MRTMAATIAGIASMCALAAGAAAQSDPACSFDGSAAALSVTVDARVARLQVITSSGEIRLNGVACAGATVTNTDSIVVTGGALGDDVRLSGSFAPGLTVEADAASEIEILFALGAGSDTVTVNLTSRPDRVTFTGGGIDVGGATSTRT